MPRLMSVAMTADAVRARQKTVTRRVGWEFLKPGDVLTLCPKVQGRAHFTHDGGERQKIVDPLERICDVEVVSVSRERLDRLFLDIDYGRREVELEGFPGMEPGVFVRTYFVDAQGMRASDEVTRIEWRYR